MSTPSIKEELIQLIESYAIAKASGNENLQRWATEYLTQKLNEVDIATLPPDSAASTENEPQQAS